MVASFKKVGEVDEIVEKGRALCFEINAAQFLNGFVVKFAGKLYAYKNKCPHAGTELDWVTGLVFDDSGLFLMCATHGALFQPDTGLCVRGPCIKLSLQRLPLRVNGNDVLVSF